jgi:hypothetical protein
MTPRRVPSDYQDDQVTTPGVIPYFGIVSIEPPSSRSDLDEDDPCASVPKADEDVERG